MARLAVNFIRFLLKDQPPFLLKHSTNRKKDLCNPKYVLTFGKLKIFRAQFLIRIRFCFVKIVNAYIYRTKQTGKE